MAAKVPEKMRKHAGTSCIQPRGNMECIQSTCLPVRPILYRCEVGIRIFSLK